MPLVEMNASWYSAKRMPVNTEVYVFPWVTASSVSVRQDFREEDAKSISTSVPRSRVITAVRARICRRVINASARLVIPELIVRRRDRIVRTIRVLRELCARMNQDTRIIRVCAGLDILVLIAMLR